EDELLTATVTKVEPNWVTLEIEKNTVSLPWREQIPGEHYYTGKRIRVYLDRVEMTTKGPQLRISRTHPNLVKRLLELEIPEVRNGDVQVMAIARDPGFRSKVAVKSTDPRIDPIGACVGQKGVRIRAVMEELNGERVDMIEWSDDPIRLIATALQPASISAVIIVNDNAYTDDQGRVVKKRAAVFVEEAQRPLAIGKKGQNIHLATELTGYELDMYNYEELPTFQAKLAELRGDGAPATIQVQGTEDSGLESGSEAVAEVPQVESQPQPQP
ncbi:MAG: transcription termination factor NusA, partial [Patescibacteria group bacterium]